MEIEYEKNGKKIYQKSFSIIREETNLSSFKKDEEKWQNFCQNVVRNLCWERCFGAEKWAT